MQANRILLVRLSALGDVTHALWSLACLRQALPDAHIGWAVEDGAAGLLRDHPHIDRLHVLPRSAWKRAWARGHLRGLGAGAGEFISGMRRERYDAAVDLQGNLRSGLVTAASGASKRVGPGRGHAKEGSHWFLTHPVALPRGPQNHVERGLTLTAGLGIEIPPRDRLPPPVIPETQEARQRVKTWLTELRQRAPNQDAAVVALHPGVSGFGAFKAWRPDGYAALAARLCRDEGAAVVVTWGPGEKPLAEQVCAQAHALLGAHDGLVEPCFETGSILELTSLLRRVDLVVASDTGPLHVAAALGTAVVGLYGAKHPITYGPWSDRAQVVRKGVPCSPCRQRSCVRPDCMNLISADQVAQAATSLLHVS